MLTRPDFLKGWLFLTAQPWGKTYRSTTAMTPTGEPNPADVQSEFYYRAFTQTTYPIWMQACQQAAQGEHWPSIDMLRQSVKSLTPTAQAPVFKASEGDIDRDEFGRELYDTIYLIGEVLGSQDQLNTAVLKGHDSAVQDFTKVNITKRKELAKVLPTLPGDLLDQLMARYPVLVSL